MPTFNIPSKIEFTLNVSKTGYISYSQEMTITEDTTVNVTLTPGPLTYTLIAKPTNTNGSQLVIHNGNYTANSARRNGRFFSDSVGNTYYYTSIGSTEAGKHTNYDSHSSYGNVLYSLDSNASSATIYAVKPNSTIANTPSTFSTISRTQYGNIDRTAGAVIIAKNYLWVLFLNYTGSTCAGKFWFGRAAVGSTTVTPGNPTTEATHNIFTAHYSSKLGICCSTYDDAPILLALNTTNYTVEIYRPYISGSSGGYNKAFTTEAFNSGISFDYPTDITAKYFVINNSGTFHVYQDIYGTITKKTSFNIPINSTTQTGIGSGIIYDKYLLGNPYYTNGQLYVVNLETGNYTFLTYDWTEGDYFADIQGTKLYINNRVAKEIKEYDLTTFLNRYNP